MVGIDSTLEEGPAPMVGVELLGALFGRRATGTAVSKIGNSAFDT